MNSFISFAKQNQVPYHTDGWDTYFLGNGIIGASATPVGEWNFLIGPDYTCPNYLGSEKLYLIVDEEAIPLEFSTKELNVNHSIVVRHLKKIGKVKKLN